MMLIDYLELNSTWHSPQVAFQSVFVDQSTQETFIIPNEKWFFELLNQFHVHRGFNRFSTQVQIKQKSLLNHQKLPLGLLQALLAYSMDFRIMYSYFIVFTVDLR